MPDNTVVSSSAFAVLTELMTKGSKTKALSIDQQVKQFKQKLSSIGRYSTEELEQLNRPVEDLVNAEIIIGLARDYFRNRCTTSIGSEYTKFLSEVWIDQQPQLSKLKRIGNQALDIFINTLSCIEAKKTTEIKGIELSDRENFAISRIEEEFSDRLGKLFSYRLLKDQNGNGILRLFTTMTSVDTLHLFDKALFASIKHSLTNELKLSIIQGYNNSKGAFAFSLDLPLAQIVSYT